MSDATQKPPAPRPRIDPDRFAELVQRMEELNKKFTVADGKLNEAAFARNEAAAKFNEARDLLRKYIQECGGPW